MFTSPVYIYRKEQSECLLLTSSCETFINISETQAKNSSDSYKLQYKLVTQTLNAKQGFSKK